MNEALLGSNPRSFIRHRRTKMNETFCTSVLRELRGINMSERERARAEDGLRKSAALVELLAGMFGRRTDRTENHA